MVMNKHSEKGGHFLQKLNVAILLLFTICMAIPVLHVFALSFSSRLAVDSGSVFLWPKEFNLESWHHMLRRKDLWTATGLTFMATVIGTVLAIIVNGLMAYPLAKKEFPLSKLLIYATVFSMIFKAPTIPYFLSLRDYGFYNNVWVLILPHILNPYNLIIMITFFRQIPRELEEAATIDGCGYFRIWSQIVIPNSKPVIGTLSLFYAVVIWNQFSHPLMFIDTNTLYPLQLRVRQLVTESDLANDVASMVENIALRQYNSETLQAVVVIFSFLPIACVYPFVQKYFAKGAMLGSVKG